MAQLGASFTQRTDPRDGAASKVGASGCGPASSSPIASPVPPPMTGTPLNDPGSPGADRPLPLHRRPLPGFGDQPINLRLDVRRQLHQARDLTLPATPRCSAPPAPADDADARAAAADRISTRGEGSRPVRGVGAVRVCFGTSRGSRALPVLQERQAAVGSTWRRCRRGCGGDVVHGVGRPPAVPARPRVAVEDESAEPAPHPGGSVAPEVAHRHRPSRSAFIRHRSIMAERSVGHASNRGCGTRWAAVGEDDAVLQMAGDEKSSDGYDGAPCSILTATSARTPTKSWGRCRRWSLQQSLALAAEDNRGPSTSSTRMRLARCRACSAACRGARGSRVALHLVETPSRPPLGDGRRRGLARPPGAACCN